MRPELIQGDSRESSEECVFPCTDIDRTYILELIIDIRYNDKDCTRRAGAVLIFLGIDNDSRATDIDTQEFAGSYHCGELNIPG